MHTVGLVAVLLEATPWLRGAARTAAQLALVALTLWQRELVVAAVMWQLAPLLEAATAAAPAP